MMAALTCDICGGKLVMGTGGIAVCDSCGVEHSKDRMQEKVQEIKGTVRVDNSHMTESWMKMGHAAASAGNHKEAYDYFTKVVEIDPRNWRAIYEKGKAGAWQSTLGNLRMPEIYQGVKLALEIIASSNLSQEDTLEVKNEFAVALFNINNAITDLMDQNLRDIDGLYFDSHWDQMWQTRQRYVTNVEQLEDAISLISDSNDDLSKSNVIEFKKRMCSDLISACAFIHYWTSYSKEDMHSLVYKASEKQKHLDKFWNLVDDIRKVEPNYATTKHSQPDPFDDYYIYNHSDKVFEYWSKKDSERREKIKQKEQERRLMEYWKEHAEEKASLEAEIQNLSRQISELNTEVSNVPERVEKTNMEDKIRKLEAEKRALGLFKGKEKKDLQDQIDVTNSELSLVTGRMNAAVEMINKKIAPLTKRQNEIKAELTKSR